MTFETLSTFTGFRFKNSEICLFIFWYAYWRSGIATAIMCLNRRSTYKLPTNTPKTIRFKNNCSRRKKYFPKHVVSYETKCQRMIFHKLNSGRFYRFRIQLWYTIRCMQSQSVPRPSGPNIVDVWIICRVRVCGFYAPTRPLQPRGWNVDRARLTQFSKDVRRTWRRCWFWRVSAGKTGNNCHVQTVFRN